MLKMFHPQKFQTCDNCLFNGAHAKKKKKKKIMYPFIPSVTVDTR